MATIEDLFGRPAGGPKWENEDDTHVLTVGAEPFLAPELDFASKKAKYMVEQSGDDGPRWGVRLEGDFDPSEHKNAFPLQVIRIPGVWEDGTEGNLDVIGQEQKAVFKKAMEDFGEPVTAGVRIAKKLVAFGGRNGRMKIFRFKIAGPVA